MQSTRLALLALHVHQLCSPIWLVVTAGSSGMSSIAVYAPIVSGLHFRSNSAVLMTLVNPATTAGLANDLYLSRLGC